MMIMRMVITMMTMVVMMKIMALLLKITITKTSTNDNSNSTEHTINKDFDVNDNCKNDHNNIVMAMLIIFIHL